MRKRVRDLVGALKGQAERRGQRRRFEASVRPSDVFIVSYPKSGTVWLRFMIENVLRKNPEEESSLQGGRPFATNINRLYFSNGSLKPFADLPDPRFFWVHAPYDRCFPKVVYVLRDPRDVVVSYWHWNRLNDSKFRLSLEEFVTRDDHWPCRWDEHVEGWLLRHQHANLIVVRYEEMHRDPAGVLGRVLGFIDVPHTAEDIKRAVAAGRFSRMKSLEEKMRTERVVFGIDNKEKTAAHPTERFIRRGQVASWKDELDPESVRIFEGKYASTMRKFGFETTAPP